MREADVYRPVPAQWGLIITGAARVAQNSLFFYMDGYEVQSGAEWYVWGRAKLRNYVQSATPESSSYVPPYTKVGDKVNVPTLRIRRHVRTAFLLTRQLT